MCVCVSGFCDNTRRGLHAGIHIKEEGGGKRTRERVMREERKLKMWRKTK